ncbi:MAG: SDR family oxidoreductase, partial [Halieaceae bacterium]|nr:SDR family oxidoreductase [Halieaceae bacterium]
MSDLLGYKGKQVVVTGAASGMGAATAQLLVDAGANVTALDIAPVTATVAKALTADMQDQSSLDDALAQCPDQVHALFNCAGVPSPPTELKDTVLINFSGLRYLTEQLLPRMQEGGAIASIASTAGMGWRSCKSLVDAFLALDPSLEAAASWLDCYAHEVADGYGFSKQCLIVYTYSQAAALAQRGIRINCIAPSPTNSAFMERLQREGGIPEDAVSLFLPPNGRYGEGADMGKAMLLLNSDLAGFISGVNLPVDYGYSGQVFVGQRDDLMGIA